MQIIFSVIALVLFFDLIDSSAGMGLGTLSVPVLLMMGYPVHQVIPTLVIGAAISGCISGLFHHEFKNVTFSLKRPLTPGTESLLIISIFGCSTILGGVALAYYFLVFPEWVIEAYVGTLLLLMALLGLINIRKNKERSYKPRRLILFASIAGFNKGVGGGGYGPVIVLGNILSGLYTKTAAAVAQTSEGIVSTIGAITFFTIMAAGGEIDLVLLPSVFTGTFFASIMGPYVLRVVPNKVWRVFIPVFAFIIGIMFMIEMFI